MKGRKTIKNFFKNEFSKQGARGSRPSDETEEEEMKPNRGLNHMDARGVWEDMRPFEGIIAEPVSDRLSDPVPPLPILTCDAGFKERQSDEQRGSHSHEIADIAAEQNPHLTQR